MPAPGDAPLALTWLADFADFIKLSGLFPSNNVRVQAAADAVVRSIRVLCGADRQLCVLCDVDGLSIAGARASLERANVTWLCGAMRSTAVAELRLAATTTVDNLLAFATKLRRNVRTARQPTTFAAMWGESIEGIEVLEKTFAIVHPEWSHLDAELRALLDEDSNRGARLRELLDLSGPVAEQLRSLGDAPSVPAMPGDCVQSGGVDLLRRILDVMPPEMLEDPAACLNTVRSVLETGLDTLQATATFRGVQDDAAFERVVIGISARYFVRPDGQSDVGHDAPTARAKQADRAPATRGHAGDERFDDDLAAFLAEFASLPDVASAKSVTALESPEEHLAVCLHRLEQVDTPAAAARLEPHLCDALSRVEPDRVATLFAPYVPRLSTPEDSAEPWRKIALLGPLLERTGLLSSMLVAGSIDVDTIVRWFPTGFGGYVDAIESDPIGLAQLDSTCAALGGSRIARAGAQLMFGEPAIIEARWNKLFATRSPHVVPFALVWFEHRPKVDTQKVAEWLSRIKLTDAASAALRVVDTRLLPRSYVQGLCELICSQARVAERRKALEKNAEALIRTYIENPPNGTEEVRIARAVSALQMFWTPRVEEFVRSLARSGGFLGMRKGPKLVREAASELLRRQMAGKR